MKASHIYINPQGEPCAPTKDFPLYYPEGTKDYQIEQWKQSAIPIREEDRGYFKGHPELDQPLIVPDCFYPVEPYEFEIEWTKPGWGTKIARIIRPKEIVHTFLGTIDDGFASEKVIHPTVEGVIGMMDLTEKSLNKQVSTTVEQLDELGNILHTLCYVLGHKNLCDKLETWRESLRPQTTKHDADICTVCGKLDHLPCFDHTDAARQRCPNYKPKS